MSEYPITLIGQMDELLVILDPFEQSSSHIWAMGGW